ncbi:MAG: hypothetical protein FJ087_23380 [Deltaproteobacteria bacterium]|nr:hypothetical protein [Deltaproteobacteria bacterium]
MRDRRRPRAGSAGAGDRSGPAAPARASPPWVVSRLGSDDIASFRALGQRSPFVAAMITVFLFSLIGLPPTAGFAGEFYLFYAVLT